MSAPRHPYRLTGGRQLATADLERHVADLVRLVLLTGIQERLHRPDFGAGLGSATLFEPLDSALRGVVEVRARGSLEHALGDRIDVVDLTIESGDVDDSLGESSIAASVTYRLRSSGRHMTVGVTRGA